MYSGYGIYDWLNGSQFEGQFENGKMNGKGKLIVRDTMVNEKGQKEARHSTY